LGDDRPNLHPIYIAQLETAQGSKPVHATSRSGSYAADLPFRRPCALRGATGESTARDSKVLAPTTAGKCSM